LTQWQASPLVDSRLCEADFAQQSWPHDRGSPFFDDLPTINRSFADEDIFEMTCTSHSVWFRPVYFFSLALGFGLAVLVPGGADAQPAEGQDAEAAEEAVNASTDNTLNIKVILEKYPEIKEILEKYQEDREGTVKKLNAFSDAHDDLPPGGVILALVFSKPAQAAFHQQALDDAVQSNPNDPDAYLMMANRAVSQRRRTEAGLLIDKAEPLLNTFAGDAERKRNVRKRFYQTRALLREQDELWQDAADDWAERLKIDDQPGVRYRYARCLFRVGTEEARKQSLAEMTKAHQQDSENITLPYVAIAKFYDEIEDTAKAEEWFKAAEKKYPEDPAAHVQLAQWQWKQGNPDEVLRHAEEAVKLDPDSLDANFWLGVVLHYRGDDVELLRSQEVLSKCQRLAPDNATIRNHLSLVRLDLGDANSTIMARDMAVETLKTNQRDPFSRATLGHILFKADARNRQTGWNYLKSVAGSPNNDIQFFLASALVDVGKTAEAKQLLDRILAGQSLFVYRAQAEKLAQALN